MVSIAVMLKVILDSIRFFKIFRTIVPSPLLSRRAVYILLCHLYSNVSRHPIYCILIMYVASKSYAVTGEAKYIGWYVYQYHIQLSHLYSILILFLEQLPLLVYQCLVLQNHGSIHLQQKTWISQRLGLESRRHIDQCDVKRRGARPLSPPPRKSSLCSVWKNTVCLTYVPSQEYSDGHKLNASRILQRSVCET